MNPTSVLSPEIVDLGLAIGLLQKSNSSVDFDSGWFSDPGPRVSRALADDDRRAALVRFVDTVNGDSPVINAGGVKLLKIFDATELGITGAPNLSVMLSIDDRPAGYVEVGLAVSFATTGPTTQTDLVVPLYRTGKKSGSTVQPVAEHFALAAGSPIRVTTSLTLSGPPDSSGFGLGGVDVTAAISVTGAAPSVEITLTDLLLPGATVPTTIHIGGPDSSIEESLLSLVLGVVRAGAAALGSAGDEALAALDLIGLGPSPQLTPIDVADLAEHGVGALRDWFTTTMADESARLAWLGALHDLIGGNVTDGLLSIPLAGGVALTIGLAAQPGPGGHLRVTPQLGVELKTTVGVGPAAVDLKARAAIDVVTVDLADGSLVAVPAAELVVDVAGHGGRLVASGPAQIGAVHLGVGVDHGQVVPVLRLLDVQAGTGPAHPVVDLSSADAVVAAAGQIAGDLVRTAIEALPAHVELEPLLGLTATGGSGVLDSAHLLVDPLGTLGGWWHELLTTARGRRARCAGPPARPDRPRQQGSGQRQHRAAHRRNRNRHGSVVGADRRSGHPRRLDGRRSPDTGVDGRVPRRHPGRRLHGGRDPRSRRTAERRFRPAAAPACCRPPSWPWRCEARASPRPGWRWARWRSPPIRSVCWRGGPRRPDLPSASPRPVWWPRSTL